MLKLDKPEVYNILQYLKPNDVLNISFTSKSLNVKCKQVVNELLDIHYPDAYHTNTPWHQYVALASNVKTYYESSKKYVDGPFKLCGRYRIISTTEKSKNGYREDHNIFNYTLPMGRSDISCLSRTGIFVDGLPVPKGKKLWVLAFESEEDYYACFRKKEQLAKDIVDESYTFQLEQIIEEVANDVYRKYDSKSKNNKVNIEAFLNDPECIEKMKEYDTHDGNNIDEDCIPFTKKNYFKSIMASSRVDMFYNWDKYWIDHIEF